MVQGKLMPCPPTILASLITITFIAVGQIPKNWLQAPTNAKGIPLSVLTVPSGDDTHQTISMHRLRKEISEPQ